MVNPNRSGNVVSRNDEKVALAGGGPSSFTKTYHWSATGPLQCPSSPFANSQLPRPNSDCLALVEIVACVSTFTAMTSVRASPSRVRAAAPKLCEHAADEVLACRAP